MRFPWAALTRVPHPMRYTDEPQRLSPVPGPPSAPPPADAFDSDSDGAAAPPPALLLEGDDDFLPPPPAEGYTRGTRSESIPPPPPETDSPPSAEAQAGRGINPEVSHNKNMLNLLPARARTQRLAQN